MITAAHPFAESGRRAVAASGESRPRSSTATRSIFRAADPVSARSITAAHILRHQGIYGYDARLLLRFVRWKPSPLERAESLEQLRALGEWCKNSCARHETRLARRGHAGRRNSAGANVLARATTTEIVSSMKYIFVTGGVVSSLGKGLAAASLGTLLEAARAARRFPKVRSVSERRSRHDESVSTRRSLRAERRRRDRSRSRPLRAFHQLRSLAPQQPNQRPGLRKRSS